MLDLTNVYAQPKYVLQAIGNQYEGKNILVVAHGEVCYRHRFWGITLPDPLQAQEELCIIHV